MPGEFSRKDITIDSISLGDVETLNCPYPAYRVMRDEAPVFWEPSFGCYIVTRYDDIRTVLRDVHTFSSRFGDPEYRDLSGRGAVATERALRIKRIYEEEGWTPCPTLAGRDDPNHKQMRAMFDEAFRPSRIKEMDGFVRDTAYRLIGAFLEDGYCDWVKQYAVPLPLIVIGNQMGVHDEAQLWLIKRWTDAFFRRISMLLDEDEEMEMVRLEIEAQHYFQPIFEKLRRAPDNSLLSDLVNTVIEAWGRPLNDSELHAEMMSDTFVGGSETTTNALSAGMMLLIDNPDVWRQLKDNPEQHLKTFVEEVVRLESPVQGLSRITTRATELGGVALPKGAVVNLRFAAANRDERHFDDPDRLDLGRRNAGSHLAFGSGSHHCLGAPLARRELYWGFKALTDMVDDMWYAPGRNDFRHHPHFLLRSLKELHVEFKPKTA